MKDKLIMWDDIELLDYIGNIERIYISEYDDYKYRDSFNITECYNGTDEFQQTLEEFTEEELRLFDLRPGSATECTDIFTARYNDNLIKRKNIYDVYKKELGCLVETLELDIDKFWFLTLFILDYCESIFYQGTTIKPTPLEQLRQLADKILDCEEDDVKLTLKSGKIKLELDSPLALAALSMFINNSIKKLDSQQIKYLSKRENKEETDVIKDSPIIVYFANMFLNFFDTQEPILSIRKEGVKHTKTEMELVSRLIYLMGLSNNKNWNDIECEYLKSFLKQYKNYRYPNNISSVYPEFNI
jgi:hypothetical protein